MTIINRVLVETLHIVEREFEKRNGIGTLATDGTAAAAEQTSSSTSSSPSPTNTNSGTSNGGTSSPLLFFVALGFGVVFTNLWLVNMLY